MQATKPHHAPRSYKDSEAYQRSNLTRADGRPTFPLGFLDRPAPQDAARKGRKGLRLIAALVAVAALAVALERRS